MTPEHFDALFDTFHTSAVRLETLPAYAVADYEGDRLSAFLDGRPLPVRSVKTDPWLARIARTTADGKVWRRVRVVDEPLTDYERFELAVFPETQAVGEEIRIVPRSLAIDGGPDVWLFDTGSPGARAVEMRYADDGQWLGVELVDDPRALAAIEDWVAGLWHRGVTLNEFLVASNG